MGVKKVFHDIIFMDKKSYFFSIRAFRITILDLKSTGNYKTKGKLTINKLKILKPPYSLYKIFGIIHVHN